MSVEQLFKSVVAGIPPEAVSIPAEPVQNRTADAEEDIFRPTEAEDDPEVVEMRALVTNRPSKAEFKAAFFPGASSDRSSPDFLPTGTLDEFYEDFIASGVPLEEYVQTQRLPEEEFWDELLANPTTPLPRVQAPGERRPFTGLTGRASVRTAAKVPSPLQAAVDDLNDIGETPGYYRVEYGGPYSVTLWAGRNVSLQGSEDAVSQKILDLTDAIADQLERGASLTGLTTGD